MDVNTTNGSGNAFFENFVIPPTNTVPVFGGGYSLSNPGSYFTVTPLTNGYVRYRFNATTAYPAGTKFGSIYLGDYGNAPGASFSDSVENVIVNGVPAIPNIQPAPQYDCTLVF